MQRYRVEVPTDEYWQRQIQCQNACPVHTDARGYVRAIAEGRFEDAYLIARGPNPLASICGRVCGAPCETDCRRKDIDEAVSIRALKRFVMDRFGVYVKGAENSPLDLLGRLIRHATGHDSSRSEDLAGFRNFISDWGLPTNRRSGAKVAIIGSGPAGLAAAHDLALLGLRPTVFEMEPVPAGMLAVGIPHYRLPRELLAAEVEFIRALGVEFVCNTQIGRDISLAEIRSQHRGTIIAVGLKKSRSVAIPGSHGIGIFGGLDILRDVALGRDTEVKGRVVVIGGGNVAYDVARTVVRQTGVDVSRTALRRPGVQTVHLCSLESLEELPADDREIIEGDEEGIIRLHGLGPREILLDDAGRVRDVVFRRCVRVFDAAGRFAPEFDDSTLTTLPADTVLWAIGQGPDLSLFDGSPDVEMTAAGLPQRVAGTLRTTAPDVFLAGDIAHGARYLIDAVASGKQVARLVFEFIEGRKLVEDVQVVHLQIPDYVREADYEKLKRSAVPALDAESRLKSPQLAVEIGYDEQQAVREGCRCFDCGVNTVFDSEKCILCGGCADVCPEICLELVSLDRIEGDELLSRTLAERMGAEESAGFSAIVKDETKCIRCALCAERCPVGAITMERVQISTCWSAECRTPPAPGGL